MKNLRTNIVASILLLLVLLGSGPLAANEYLLGVGDAVRITVWGHEELATQTVVRPDGYLTFPLVGDIWAVDKTTRQLRTELQSLLADFVVNPQVTVIVTQFRTVRVQLLGEVARPGNYNLSSGARLLDVLASAGGPLNNADLSRVNITRYELGGQQSKVLTVDVRLFLEQGQLEGNPLVEGDDMIFVPASGRATIFGEVRQPRSYDLGSGLDLLDLMALAGGSLDSADLENVVITSQIDGQPVEQVVNVQNYMAGREKPVAIKPNDVIFVPKKQQVMVVGAVRNPGIYTLHSDAHLVDILARAGGVTAAGDASAVAITRKGISDQEILIVNAQPGLSGRTGGDNPRLVADDLIFVPEGYRNALVLGQVRSPGSYALDEQTRLLDLLARAGGTTDRAGEELTLTRDGVAKTVDIGALERFGLQNEPVEPGDVIFVPEGERRVLILGEVRSPGYHQFRPGDRVLDVIGLAGGLTTNALQEQVSLSRPTPEGTDIFMIDFSGLMDNRYLADNLHVQGGDVIIVPAEDRGVIVLGEVQRPGYYTYRSGDGLLDAIMLAGGFTQNANEERVSLTRQTGGETEVEGIDFSLLMEDGFLAQDKPLQGGDIIMVPRSERNVLVLGEVRNPGYYSFAKGQSFVELIGRAGGFTANADVAKVHVTMETADGLLTEVLNLDVLAGANDNRPLQGGEVITVPRANNVVLVFGEVVRPGAYTLAPQGRLLDILAAAGGLQSNVGSENVVVTRQDGNEEQVWQVNYGSLMAAQSENNLALAGGDVIYVPASRRQILVLGMVKNPGVYTLPMGARVLDALAMAGGPLERAALENVGIYRDGSLEGADIVAMGQDKMLFTGDASENPLLQAGDIIYVPETKKPDWTKIFGFVGAISTFKNSLLNIIRW
jgi:protein involved in polysaccharide export with SLBB domain